MTVNKEGTKFCVFFFLLLQYDKENNGEVLLKEPCLS